MQLKKVFTRALLACSLTVSLLPISALAASQEATTDYSVVQLEAIDPNGKPATDTTVVITALSGGSSREVFNGQVNKNGKITFKSEIPQDVLNNAPGEVADMVYEATFVSANGELVDQFFVVSHPKNKIKQSNIETNQEPVNVKVKFTGVSLEEKMKGQPKDKDIQYYPQEKNKVSTLATGCTWTGLYYKCVTEESYYTEPVKIGTVNVSNGEKVDFNLTSSAKSTLDWGYKATADAGWSIGGGLSLSSDVSTSVDYSINGTGMIFWGTYEDNLSRDIFANYNFRYSVTDIYNELWEYIYTKYEIVPTGLAGSSTKEVWNYNSNNDKPVSSVQSSSYGSWFQINSGATTTKSYKNEKTFYGAIEIPSVGFTGKTTTAYMNSHSIKWSTSLTNKTFYHYDYDNTGNMWYVTY